MSLPEVDRTSSRHLQVRFPPMPGGSSADIRWLGGVLELHTSPILAGLPPFVHPVHLCLCTPRVSQRSRNTGREDGVLGEKTFFPTPLAMRDQERNRLIAFSMSGSCPADKAAAVSGRLSSGATPIPSMISPCAPTSLSERIRRKLPSLSRYTPAGPETLPPVLVPTIFPRPSSSSTRS
jgi:hypothetical protein